MIANYILYGTQPDAERGLHLVPKELHTIPKTDGGLQIPQIIHTIRRQRFKMLQELVRIGTSTREPWTVIACLLFQRSLGSVCDGFDWLWTRPKDWPRRQVASLPARWRSSWEVWSEIDWPTPAPPRGAWESAVSAANGSIWLALRPKFQPTAPAAYLAATPAVQSLCTRLASAGFMNATSFRTALGLWPSYADFYARVGTTLGPTRSPHLIYKLYSLLTRYVHPTLPLLIPDRTQLSPKYLLPQRGLQVRDDWVSFPHIPKLSCFRIITTPGPQLRRDHPLKDHGLDPSTTPRDHVRRLRTLSRAVTPVIRDVHTRLSLKLLPTGSRLWRDRDGSNTARLWSHVNCRAIETDRHLFFECAPIRELWQTQWTAWSILLCGQLLWQTIIFPYAVRVRPQFTAYRHGIIILWHVASCILLHQAWRDRNARVFDTIAPPAQLARHNRVLSTFAAHVRSLRRRHGDDTELLDSFTIALDQLTTSLAYAPIRTRLEPTSSAHHLQVWTTRAPT